MRHADWADRLHKYLYANLDTKFDWGRFDCCLFAANAVQEMTGTDYAAAFRNHYSTKLGASKALKKYGAGTIEQTLTTFFGPLKPRLTAGRGDLVLVDTTLGHALGIVWAGKIWCAGTQGLSTLPLSSALGCWEVN